MIIFVSHTGVPMAAFLLFLAQMKDPPLDGKPPLFADVGTSGMTWVIAAILTAGILLVTFKTSKRNHLERD
jgi:hypothetical protein